VLGQLFVEYAGIPAVTGKCNSSTCERAQTTQMSVEYWFPTTLFWSKIVRFQMTYLSNLGPSFQLRTLRRVPDSAPAVNFAMNGNIQGLQELFRRGTASPQDVSDTRGYSLLRVWLPGFLSYSFLALIFLCSGRSTLNNIKLAGSFTTPAPTQTIGMFHRPILLPLSARLL
jgi:hypothetical protein